MNLKEKKQNKTIKDKRIHEWLKNLTLEGTFIKKNTELGRKYIRKQSDSERYISIKDLRETGTKWIEFYQKIIEEHAHEQGDSVIRSYLDHKRHPNCVGCKSIMELMIWITIFFNTNDNSLTNINRDFFA